MASCSRVGGWIGVLAGVASFGLLSCGGGEEAAAPAAIDVEGAGARAEQGSERAPADAPAFVVDPATAGMIRGVARFEGIAPKNVIGMGADAECARAHGGKRVFDESVVVDEDGTLRNVFVQVLKGLEGKRFEPPAEPVLLDQKGCLYVPHVLAFQLGQGLVVRNSDRTNHNINGRPRRNQNFNFGQATQGIENRLEFEHPETFSVRCDRHGWMQAWIHVVPHPFFAVTGEGGAFEIGGLPPGAYTIEAWHEKYGRQTREVALAASGTESLEFTFREGTAEGGSKK